MYVYIVCLCVIILQSKILKIIFCPSTVFYLGRITKSCDLAMMAMAVLMPILKTLSYQDTSKSPPVDIFDSSIEKLKNINLKIDKILNNNKNSDLSATETISTSASTLKSMENFIVTMEKISSVFHNVTLPSNINAIP